MHKRGAAPSVDPTSTALQGIKKTLAAAATAQPFHPKVAAPPLAEDTGSREAPKGRSQRTPEPATPPLARHSGNKRHNLQTTPKGQHTQSTGASAATPISAAATPVHSASGKSRKDQTRPKKSGREHKRKPRNTESFAPCHEEPDMRLIVAPRGPTFTRKYGPNDVAVGTDFFCAEESLDIYEALLSELQAAGCDDLFVLWHGDSHLIADDKKKGGRWKAASPTFTKVVNQMREYFGLDVKATRFNWYRDSSDWKPFHHDRAAFTPDCPQNITVAASFGAERECAFLHATKGSVLNVPLPNGSMYAFGRDVNINWKHGIPQVAPDKAHTQGRISIIAWAWVDMD